MIQALRGHDDKKVEMFGQKWKAANEQAKKIPMKIQNDIGQENAHKEMAGKREESKGDLPSV